MERRTPGARLTARVIVNRIWHHHFGRGIVRTLDNLGQMGDVPTHPELLDWLAVEFMERGWSIKEMHRLLMTSEAYQMVSSDQAILEADRDNRGRGVGRWGPRVAPAGVSGRSPDQERRCTTTTSVSET